MSPYKDIITNLLDYRGMKKLHILHMFPGAANSRFTPASRGNAGPETGTVKNDSPLSSQKAQNGATLM